MDISVPTFPIRHCSLSLDVEGNRTEIIISRYEDHFLVIVTQIGSMGTILHARKEEGMSVHPTFTVSVTFGKRDEERIERFNKSEKVIGNLKDLMMFKRLHFHSICSYLSSSTSSRRCAPFSSIETICIGSGEMPMLVACARQLIEHMSSSGYSKGLVLSLGLRDHSVATLKHIVSAVIEKLPLVT